MDTAKQKNTHSVYLAFGSNMGDREAYIHRAIALLKPVATCEALSSLYETEPVGFTDQGWFVNCVGKFSTALSPMELLQYAASIEQQLDRVRRIKNGPRTIDIDLLLYDDRVIHEDGLQIPHPRMHERRFVLAPLADIAPDVIHPLFHKTIAELLHELPEDMAIRRLPGTSTKKVLPANDI